MDPITDRWRGWDALGGAPLPAGKLCGLAHALRLARSDTDAALALDMVLHPVKLFDPKPAPLMNAERLSQSRLGRTWLHFDCMRRGGSPAWHLQGMLRQWLPSHFGKRRKKHG